jgi:hypothetical protein
VCLQWCYQVKKYNTRAAIPILKYDLSYATSVSIQVTCGLWAVLQRFHLQKGNEGIIFNTVLPFTSQNYKFLLLALLCISFQSYMYSSIEFSESVWIKISVWTLWQCGPFLVNEVANVLPRRDWVLESYQTLSVDNETESCKHLGMGSVTMELTFLAQCMHKQQKQGPLKMWFLHSSRKVIKGFQMRLRGRVN